MGSLIEELQRREAEARQEVDELRGEIARLNDRLARAEEALSRLEITRETVTEILGGADAERPAARQVADVLLTAPQAPRMNAIAYRRAVCRYRIGNDICTRPCRSTSSTSWHRISGIVRKQRWRDQTIEQVRSTVRETWAVLASCAGRFTAPDPAGRPAR